MKIYKIILPLVIFIHVENVHASTGNDLLASCDTKEINESGSCYGYIMGYVSGYDEGLQHGAVFQKYGYDIKRLKKHADDVNKISNLARYYCLPNKVTYTQMRDVIIQFLKDNPSLRHKPASTNIVAALSFAFPCQQ